MFQDTALDDCTRLRVARVAPALTNSAGLSFLATLRQAFPFERRRVQTDNDAPFTNRDHGRAEDGAGQDAPPPPLHARLRDGGDGGKICYPCLQDYVASRKALWYITVVARLAAAALEANTVSILTSRVRNSMTISRPHLLRLFPFPLWERVEVRAPAVGATPSFLA